MDLIALLAIGKSCDHEILQSKNLKKRRSSWNGIVVKEIIVLKMKDDG